MTGLFVMNSPVLLYGVTQIKASHRNPRQRGNKLPRLPLLPNPATPAAEAAMLAAPVLCMYTLYQFGAACNFQAPGWPLVGKTTKLQAEMQ